MLFCELLLPTVGKNFSWKRQCLRVYVLVMFYSFPRKILSSIDTLLKHFVSSRKPLYRNLVSIQMFIIQKISFFVLFPMNIDLHMNSAVLCLPALLNLVLVNLGGRWGGW